MTNGEYKFTFLEDFEKVTLNEMMKIRGGVLISSGGERYIGSFSNNTIIINNAKNVTINGYNNTVIIRR